MRPPSEDTNPRALLRRTAIIGLLPLAAIWLCFALGIRLGQPQLFYRYSESLYLLRGFAAVPALLIAAGGVFGLYIGLTGSASSPRAAFGLAITGYIALMAWTVPAPPRAVEQHLFNLESPSHEGAFTIEADRIRNLRRYVSRDFYQTLQRSPAEMKGTRVLSNPPGMTAIAWLVREFYAATPPLRNWVDRHYINDTDDPDQQLTDPNQRIRFGSHLVLIALMTAVWGASLAPAFWLARQWLPIHGAVVVSFAAVFNPATINFTPGKDPMQLFTVLMLLAAWSHAWRTGNVISAMVAGASFAAGLAIGLIHVWILAIIAGATAWHSLCRRHENDSPEDQNADRTGISITAWLTRLAAPSFGGFLALAGCLYLALGWNLFRSTWAVGLRYGALQQGIIADPWYLTLLGLPLFMLFAGPLLWLLVAPLYRTQRDDIAAFGRKLLVCTLVVLTYTYCFANNNETPRLWIPFIPVLLLGLAVRRQPLRAPATDLARKLCILLVALQVTVSVLHWSVMDVRESEYRLISQRMFE